MNHPTSGWNSGSMGTSRGTGRRFGLTMAVIAALTVLVLLGIAALLVLLLSSGATR